LTDSAATNPDIHILEQLLAVGRRRWKSLVLFILAGLILAFLFSASRAPLYSASAAVLVRSGFAADPVRPGIETITPEEEGQFLSQLEYMESTAVAARVADKLKLTDDPDFARPAVSGYKRLIAEAKRLAHLGAADKVEPGPKLDRDEVITLLRANVGAARVGRTYVATISYTHPDPAEAQKVAQAFAEAFRDTLSDANAAINAKVRAAVEAELAKATPDTKAGLQQKYEDTLIERAVPGVDAVVITDARKPTAPSSPRKPFILAIGGVLGAALGCLFAGWREMKDRGVRDGDRLALSLKTRFLGYIPAMAVDRKPGNISANNLTLPAGARLAASEPFSRFSEVVRSAAVAARAGRPSSVIGVTSVLAGEGKTGFVANLAAHLGNQGHRVLLIDADVRRPELSNWLAPGAEMGIVDTLLQNKPLTETGLYDSRSNITFLPAALNGRGVEPAGLLSGTQMRDLLIAQRGQHEAIILNLPPLTTAADAAAAAPIVDAYILLAEWGTPSPELIETVLAGEPEIAGKLAGLALTRTNLRKLPLYVTAASRGAYQKRIG
jgi:Mrp family chromosome partitioning ATPase